MGLVCLCVCVFGVFEVGFVVVGFLFILGFVFSLCVCGFLVCFFVFGVFF